jgi:hypothetical protein
MAYHPRDAEAGPGAESGIGGGRAEPMAPLVKMCISAGTPARRSAS